MYAFPISERKRQRKQYSPRILLCLRYDVNVWHAICQLFADRCNMLIRSSNVRSLLEVKVEFDAITSLCTNNKHLENTAISQENKVIQWSTFKPNTIQRDSERYWVQVNVVTMKLEVNLDTFILYVCIHIDIQ